MGKRLVIIQNASFRSDEKGLAWPASGHSVPGGRVNPERALSF